MFAKKHPSQKKGTHGMYLDKPNGHSDDALDHSDGKEEKTLSLCAHPATLPPIHILKRTGPNRQKTHSRRVTVLGPPPRRTPSRAFY